MSLYKRAWRFTGWMMLVFVTMPLWLFSFLDKFGDEGLFAGFVLWLLPWVFAMLLLKCDYCGTSVFRTGPSYLPIYTPWPHRRCRGCGADLTAS